MQCSFLLELQVTTNDWHSDTKEGEVIPADFNRGVANYPEISYTFHEICQEIHINILKYRNLKSL